MASSSPVPAAVAHFYREVLPYMGGPLPEQRCFREENNALHGGCQIGGRVIVKRMMPLSLLRPPEQAPVDCFGQDVTLNRFHHIGARLESVG